MKNIVRTKERLKGRIDDFGWLLDNSLLMKNIVKRIDKDILRLNCSTILIFTYKKRLP
jgi:hypothetical protein